MLVGTGILLAAVLAVLAVPAIRHWREVPPPPPAPVRATWAVPPDLSVGAGPDFPFGLALAPDGRRVVFPGTRDGGVQLWLQDLGTGSVTALPGTEGAALPFWSPDGSRVGFFARDRFFVFSFDQSVASDALDAPDAAGGSWNARGDLLVAAASGRGITLHGAGGTRAVTTLDEAAGETAHLLPAFLPDGEHFVFLVRADSPARAGVWIGSLDGETPRERLARASAHGVPAAGRLLFASDGALVAQSIDVDARRLTGPVAVLGVAVGQGPLGQLFVAAANDTIIYGPPGSSQRSLVWAARDGTRGETVGAPGDIWSARVAPDGRRVAATVLDPLLRTLDVVIFDGAARVPARVSISIDADEWPVWSPDGLRLAWISAGRTLTVRGAGAVLPAEPVRRFDGRVRVTDWTPDGTGLIVARDTPDTREDLWLVPVGGDGQPEPIAATPFADVQGTISPDGRRLAYASDESGRFEIYLEGFRDRSPEPATRERVTSGGGSDPRWSRDGGELFFRRESEIHVATPANGRGQRVAATTSLLFDTEVDLRTFDVSPDGRRFLLNVPASTAARGPATLIVHWTGYR